LGKGSDIMKCPVCAIKMQVDYKDSNEKVFACDKCKIYIAREI